MTAKRKPGQHLNSRGLSKEKMPQGSVDSGCIREPGKEASLAQAGYLQEVKTEGVWLVECSGGSEKEAASGTVEGSWLDMNVKPQNVRLKSLAFILRFTIHCV